MTEEKNEKIKNEQKRRGKKIMIVDGVSIGSAQ